MSSPPVASAQREEAGASRREVRGASVRQLPAVLSLLVAVATTLASVALAVLILLGPWFVHPALDASRAADWLGTTPEVARALSDRSIGELLVGPGSFAFTGPDGSAMYDASERAHLAEARTLLWATLGAGLASIMLLVLAVTRTAPAARPTLWRAIARGGALTALGALVLGLAGLLAFGPLFELFHRVFFPGGGWAFDPGSQRLVQLYPLGFWQLATAGLLVLVAAIGGSSWWVARRMERVPPARGTHP